MEPDKQRSHIEAAIEEGLRVWVERLHPRARGGKFAPKPGGGTTSHVREPSVATPKRVVPNARGHHPEVSAPKAPRLSTQAPAGQHFEMTPRGGVYLRRDVHKAEASEPAIKRREVPTAPKPEAAKEEHAAFEKAAQAILKAADNEEADRKHKAAAKKLRRSIRAEVRQRAAALKAKDDEADVGYGVKIIHHGDHFEVYGGTRQRRFHATKIGALNDAYERHVEHLMGKPDHPHPDHQDKFFRQEAVAGSEKKKAKRVASKVHAATSVTVRDPAGRKLEKFDKTQERTDRYTSGAYGDAGPIGLVSDTAVEKVSQLAGLDTEGIEKAGEHIQRAHDHLTSAAAHVGQAAGLAGRADPGIGRAAKTVGGRIGDLASAATAHGAGHGTHRAALARVAANIDPHHIHHALKILTHLFASSYDQAKAQRAEAEASGRGSAVFVARALEEAARERLELLALAERAVGVPEIPADQQRGHDGQTPVVVQEADDAGEMHDLKVAQVMRSVTTLAEAIARFDPAKHPRDRKGRWERVLAKLRAEPGKVVLMTDRERKAFKAGVKAGRLLRFENKHPLLVNATGGLIGSAVYTAATNLFEAAEFDPRLHPRGRGGKFREVIAKPHIPHVTNAAPPHPLSTAPPKPPRTVRRLRMQTTRTQYVAHLHEQWAQLDRDLLPYAGQPRAPEAMRIVRKQQTLTKLIHHANLEIGKEKQTGPVRDVVIVGSGPAGLSAAIYGATEGLDTLMIDAGPEAQVGGQIGHTSRMENTLGFPVGVTGRQYADMGLQQATRVGAECRFGTSVERIDYDTGTHLKTLHLSDGSTIRTRAVVVAGGVQFRHMNFPGSDLPAVSYGDSAQVKTDCDGGPAVIVGGANSAGQAAVDAASSASHVTLLVRSNIEKGMSEYLISQLRSDPKVTILEGAEIDRADAASDGKLGAVKLKDGRTIPARALGLYIGSAPRTDWLGAERDERGYVKVKTSSPRPLETSIPGVFAAGDVRAGSVHRVITAAADGAAAISQTFPYLTELRQSLGLTEAEGEPVDWDGLEHVAGALPDDPADSWMAALARLDRDNPLTGLDVDDRDVQEAGFDERLHPRDRIGEFRDTGAAVKKLLDPNEQWWAGRKLGREAAPEDFEKLEPGEGFETVDGFRIERASDKGGLRAIDAYAAIRTNVYGPVTVPKEKRVDRTFDNQPRAAHDYYQRVRHGGARVMVEAALQRVPIFDPDKHLRDRRGRFRDMAFVAVGKSNKRPAFEVRVRGRKLGRVYKNEDGSWSGEATDGWRGADTSRVMLGTRMLARSEGRPDPGGGPLPGGEGSRVPSGIPSDTSPAQAVANVRAALERAHGRRSPEEIDEDGNFYPQKKQELTDYAKRYGLDPARVIGAAAAFAPGQNPKNDEQNLDWLRSIGSGATPGSANRPSYVGVGYGYRNFKRAHDVLWGRRDAHVMLKRNTKLGEYLRAIEGDKTAWVIDVHNWRDMTGATDRDDLPLGNLTQIQYRRYREAMNAAGFTSRDQAIIWGDRRREGQAHGNVMVPEQVLGVTPVYFDDPAKQAPKSAADADAMRKSPEWKPKFDQFRNDAYLLARRYGVRISALEPNVGVFEGNYEPSFAVHVTGEDANARAFNRQLGKVWGQHAVVGFRQDKTGTDREVRFTKIAADKRDALFTDLKAIMGDDAGASFDRDGSVRIFIGPDEAMAKKVAMLAKKYGTRPQVRRGVSHYLSTGGGGGRHPEHLPKAW